MLTSFSIGSPDARRVSRRIFRRRATLYDRNRRAAVGQTVDISMQGIGVHVDFSLPVGAVCVIEFNASYTPVPQLLRLEGHVAYCVLAGIDGFRIGFHVPQVDAATRKQLEHIMSMQSY